MALVNSFFGIAMGCSGSGWGGCAGGCDGDPAGAYCTNFGNPPNNDCRCVTGDKLEENSTDIVDVVVSATVSDSCFGAGWGGCSGGCDGDPAGSYCTNFGPPPNNDCRCVMGDVPKEIAANPD